MTFNDDARIDTSKVSRRRNVGIAVGGGGGLLVIGLFILSQFLGVDLTGLAGGGQPQQGQAVQGQIEPSQPGRGAQRLAGVAQRYTADKVHHQAGEQAGSGLEQGGPHRQGPARPGAE